MKSFDLLGRVDFCCTLLLLIFPNDVLGISFLDVFQLIHYVMFENAVPDSYKTVAEVEFSVCHEIAVF